MQATGFAVRLREATKQVHREAERTGFIADLIRGKATLWGYALLLRNLMPAYAALEAALAQHASENGVVAGFALAGLRRSERLAADLEVLAGPGWRDRCDLLPEAESYAAAIKAAAEAKATRLAAHAYARYLGDLSGGQILKPLLSRTLGLGPNALGFYDFPDFPDTDVPKQVMRDALDTVPQTGVAADAMIQEAIGAFHHNIAVSLAVSRAAQISTT